MTLQIKEERQDSAYGISGGYQHPPPVSLQNGCSNPPSHPSQLNSQHLHGLPAYQNNTMSPALGPAAFPMSSGQQPPFYPPPVPQGFNSAPEKPKEVEVEKPKVSENQIDFSSVKGIFGWTTIDGINVPYIFRKEKKFVSVRVVEQKLLSRYPNSYPDELGKHQPLTSYFITVHEAKLLNEINMEHCGGEFGQKQFNAKDLIVLLEDFVDFYNLVKKTFPLEENSAPQQNPASLSTTVYLNSAEEDSGDPCGWIQVNNTVTPYVKRKGQGKFVPLSVMKYAAALVIPEKGVLPTDEECDLLNKACKLAGFNFTFSKTTRIICLSDITKHCNVHLIELPMENPLQHAQYLDLSPEQVSPSKEPSPKPPKAPPSAEIVLQSNEQSNAKQVSPTHTRFPPPGPALGQQYYDPRYMFSYNRYPIYPPQHYGPPNVTVNQPHPAFPQMPMSRPQYIQNGQIPPRHSMNSDQMNNRTSPARSITGYGTNNKSQINSRGGNMGQSQMMQQLSYPNQNHFSRSIPRGVTSQYPGQNQQMPQRQSNPHTQRGPVPGKNGHPASQFPFIPNYPMPNVGQHPNETNQQHLGASSNPSIPPPPNMSGPHQAMGQRHPPPHGAGNNNQRQQTPHVAVVAPQNVKGARPNMPHQHGGPLRHDLSKAQGQTYSVLNGKQNDNKENHKSVGSVNKKPVPGLVDKIKGVWLAGKSISCMHLDKPPRNGKFCLVEAVCKLYFNGCSVNEFLYALENVLSVPLVTCTDDEEKSFIHYYSLPVSVLKCNKMINFDDLEKYFPQLSYMFREKTGSNGDVPKTDGSNTANASSQQNKSHIEPGIKRSASQAGGPPVKKKNIRLDEITKRLMTQHVSSNSGDDKGRGNNSEAGGAVIILD